MKRVTYETFLTVSRLRNFHRAAGTLNTTQSTVSARIAALESDLGVRLFDRTSKSVTLTATGCALIPKAKTILAAMDEFDTEAGLAPVQSGTLRLALSETMVNTLLPVFMHTFSKKYPTVDVNLTIDNTHNQRQLLLNRDVDLAFLMGPISEYQVINLPLVNLPMIWAVSPDHPSVASGKLTLEDFERSPILTYARSSRPFVELLAALTSGGVQQPRLFSSNALNASLLMARAGLGIGTLPEIFASPYLISGEITQVTADISLNDLRFTASYMNEAEGGLAEAAATLAADLAGPLIENFDR